MSSSLSAGALPSPAAATLARYAAETITVAHRPNFVLNMPTLLGRFAWVTIFHAPFQRQRTASAFQEHRYTALVAFEAPGSVRKPGSPWLCQSSPRSYDCAIVTGVDMKR